MTDRLTVKFRKYGELNRATKQYKFIEMQGIVMDKFISSYCDEKDRFIIDSFYLILGEDRETYTTRCAEITIIA